MDTHFRAETPNRAKRIALIQDCRDVEPRGFAHFWRGIFIMFWSYKLKNHIDAML